MTGDLQRLFRRKEELEQLLNAGRFDTRAGFVEANREYARIVSCLNLYKEVEEARRLVRDNQALLREEDQDDEMIGMIQEDLDLQTSRLTALEKRLLQKLLPEDKLSGRPVIVEIRAGTGGAEAALFAGDLFRMYQRFAELQGFHLEVLSSSQNELGGIKEIVFSVKGEEAWNQFKYESGTHRVQRVPVTETSGRIHTSAVTVAILPEPEEVEVVIDPRELRVDTYRSSGPGGQSVNTMDSAIRITHLPSGMVVTCQDEKSQHKNKVKAMRILRARLLEQQQREDFAKRSADRKNQVGTGDRSEKIRTYNFPQNRVTDHRIPMTWHNLGEILEGRLDLVQAALLEDETRDLLSGSEENPA